MVVVDGWSRDVVPRQPSVGVRPGLVSRLVARVRLDVLPYGRVSRAPCDRRRRLHGRGDRHDRGSGCAGTGRHHGAGVCLLLALRGCCVARDVHHDLPDPVSTSARREVVVPAVLLLSATAILLWWLGLSAATAQTDPIARGREIFLTGCSSCHGSEGQGVTAANGQVRGPSIITAGAAGAYFQLSTGRMPAAASAGQAERKPPVYSAADIDLLVAYVASLGDGPALPGVDVTHGNLAVGGELFRANCAACHSA